METVELFISVIIPNYNGEKTIGHCLKSVFSSKYKRFEVIVVDDCSTDNSIEAIKGYPCTLIRLSENGGASKARNTGAFSANGDALFFIDSDCVLKEDTLDIAARAFREHTDSLIGGTYTPVPYDKGFFSRFQSVFVNYSETKYREPDYIATHAMLINKGLFLKSGGFKEDFYPILEDVEFSHRLKKDGIGLVMIPELSVRHIFNYSLGDSLKNAVRKSMYWTMYSIKNRDMHRDSGTASIELKVNSLAWILSLIFLAIYASKGSISALFALYAVFTLNILVNKRFIGALIEGGGVLFAIGALSYYIAIYPAAVGTGGLLGILRKR